MQEIFIFPLSPPASILVTDTLSQSSRAPAVSHDLFHFVDTAKPKLHIEEMGMQRHESAEQYKNWASDSWCEHSGGIAVCEEGSKIQEEMCSITQEWVKPADLVKKSHIV